MKKYWLISFIFFLLVVINPSSTFSESETTSQSEQYRLQQIEKQQATKTATVATSSTKTKHQTISFVEGQITATNATSLFVDTKAGTKLIYTSDTTKFFNLDSAGKKLIGIIDLKLNDKIYIIGLSNFAVSGSAKIIVRDQTKTIKNFSLIGKISEIADKNIILTNFTRNDLPNLRLQIANETTFTNSRQKILKLVDLKTSDKILVSGFFDDRNNLVTVQVFKIASENSQTATQSSK